MANEVNFHWFTGQTLTFSVYQRNGTVRETDSALTETPASSGLYLGTPTTIVAGDNVVIKDGTSVVGGGEYSVELSRFEQSKHLGDFEKDKTVYFSWSTKEKTPSGGTIRVYKDDDSAEVTSPTGITDNRDYDGLTGIHICEIDLSANSFYEKGKDYTVVLYQSTIDGKVTTEPIATFSIEKRWQHKPFTPGG